MAADEWMPRELDADDAVATETVVRGGSLAAIFAAHRNELYSFLRRATRDPEAAEDLLQDAFLQLARALDAGRQPDNIRAWLYRVASNLAISRARRRTTVLAWLDRHGATESRTTAEESPESGVLRTERRARLDTALEMLHPDARAALLLSAEGFSGLEIAAAIGRSHSATRTLMSRARVTLRLSLEDLRDVR